MRLGVAHVCPENARIDRKIRHVHSIRNVVAGSVSVRLLDFACHALVFLARDVLSRTNAKLFQFQVKAINKTLKRAHGLPSNAVRING